MALVNSSTYNVVPYIDQADRPTAIQWSRVISTNLGGSQNVDITRDCRYNERYIKANLHQFDTLLYKKNG